MSGFNVIGWEKNIATSDDVAINLGLLPHATYTDFAQKGKTIGGGNPSATIFVILDLNVLFILTSIQRNSLYGSCLLHLGESGAQT